MNTSAGTPQERLDSAFTNYFAMSQVLSEDLSSLLDAESESQHWRRNFVRASAALLEGYAHCLREMCLVGLDCVSPPVSGKEVAVLRSERGFDANDRFKLTIRAAYKMFELHPMPDFGGPEWLRAQGVLEKRHRLMHPKVPSDLEVPDALWSELRASVTWLMKQLFDFFSLAQAKYGDGPLRS